VTRWNSNSAASTCLIHSLIHSLSISYPFLIHSLSISYPFLIHFLIHPASILHLLFEWRFPAHTDDLSPVLSPGSHLVFPVKVFPRGVQSSSCRYGNVRRIHFLEKFRFG